MNCIVFLFIFQEMNNGWITSVIGTKHGTQGGMELFPIRLS